MKTVWHWANIFKMLGLTALAGLIVSLLNLPESFGVLVGMAAGGVVGALCCLKWEMWHFE